MLTLFLLRLDGHIVGIVLTLGAVPLDGVFAVRRLVGQHDGGLIEVGELLFYLGYHTAHRLDKNHARPSPTRRKGATKEDSEYQTFGMSFPE